MWICIFYKNKLDANPQLILLLKILLHTATYYSHTYLIFRHSGSANFRNMTQIRFLYVFHFFLQNLIRNYLSSVIEMKSTQKYE